MHWFLNGNEQEKRVSINTNIDACNDFEIKCNGESILFVKKVKLLGVIWDEYFTFDSHTISFYSKINWKIRILKKSSCLYSMEFRVMLFKLFIQSNYNYCSSMNFK